MSGPEVWASDRRAEGSAPPVDIERVRTAAAAVLVAEGRPEANLSVSLTDDEEIAVLHAEYLGVPGPTDVISFPLEDDFAPESVLGEVVVSVDTAAREATERGLPFEHELLLYVIHGTLHLLGYDDREEAERTRMHARQDELLARFLAG